jgi:NTP pyrophosphatase (non-canonical NTP hydrolase)
MEPMGLRHEAEHVFGRMIEEVHRLNKSKGWFDEERSFGDDIALLHSELSEALDAFRKHGLDDMTKANPPGFESGTSKPQGVASELADVLIRLLDMAKRWDVDLVTEFERKMKFNWTRPYRHGGKKL